MDTDTIIILTMLTAAFCWWLKIQFLESKKLAEENLRKSKDQLMRAERIKRLLNRQ
jgi:hypothetical protein